MTLTKYLLPGLFILLIGYATKVGLDIYNVSEEVKELKEEYASVNRINYGLFNIQLWKDKAFNLFRDKAKEFSISPKVYTDVEGQLGVYLVGVYNEYIESGKLFNEMLSDAEKSGKINNFMATILRDNIGEQVANLDIKGKIPSIAKTLSQELKSNEPKLREYIAEGLEGMLFEGEGAIYRDPRQNFFSRLNVADVDEYNSVTNTKIETLNARLDGLVKMEYGILLAGVLLILALSKFMGIVTSISLVTVISIIFLGLGISLPMIDIDGRLNAFRMDLLGSEIAFDEQFLYYQSKSILDVTWTLIKGKGVDLKIVGVMILMFSVVIPFIKLVLSSLFMYTESLRESKVTKVIIFYLGKWSMADVFVVAMFMAYIGFYGVITSQLDEIGTNQTGYAVETLNYSSLSPGALFFTTYCILSILTGILINKWHGKES